MNRLAGFTLLEMLVAMAVFALIAAVTYGAVAPAGEGFRTLQEARDTLERAWQLERRLRLDVNALARSEDPGVQVLRVTHAQRGGDAFDQLWLLVADAGAAGLVQVHYFLDEHGMLVRESIMPWARSGRMPVRWEIRRAEAFEVQAMSGAPNARRQWADVWNAKQSGRLPRALRIRWRDAGGMREMILPVFLEDLPSMGRGATT